MTILTYFLTVASVLVVYLVVEQIDEVVEDLALHVAHIELLLGVLAYLAYPHTARLYIVGMYAVYVGLGDVVYVVIVEYKSVSPRPLIVAVTAVDGHKLVDDALHVVEGAVLNLLDKPLFLALGQQES